MLIFRQCFPWKVVSSLARNGCPFGGLSIENHLEVMPSTIEEDEDYACGSIGFSPSREQLLSSVQFVSISLGQPYLRSTSSMDTAGLPDPWALGSGLAAGILPVTRELPSLDLGCVEVSLFSELFLPQAPKRRIGGSGPSAVDFAHHNLSHRGSPHFLVPSRTALQVCALLRPLQATLCLSLRIIRRPDFIFSQGHHCLCALKSRIGSSGPTARALTYHDHFQWTWPPFAQACHSSFDFQVQAASFGFPQQPGARSDCQANTGVATFLPTSSLGRALNTRIGSSGAGACHTAIAGSTSPWEARGGCQLFAAGELLLPFMRSFLLLVALSLVKLLVSCIPGRWTPLGKFLRAPTSWVSPTCLLPLSVANAQQPVLDWSAAPPRRIPRGTQKFVPPHSLGRLGRFGLFFLGFLHLPVCVWSMPTGCAPELAILLTEEYAAMSTDPPAPQTATSDSATRPPLEPEALPGQCIDLPEHVHGPAPYPQDRWLGVTVYAPHTQPTVFAIRAQCTTTLSTVIADVRQAGRLPHPDFDTVVAVHPQPCDGYLTLLAYPSVISQGAELHCAVLLDLTRVGGHQYAATLPETITTAELIDYIRPQTRADIDETDLQVWVGYAAIPASSTGRLSLSHGTLISVTRVPFGPSRPVFVFELFSETAAWHRIDHMPRPPQIRDLALYCGHELVAVQPSFFPWATPDDIVRKVFRLHPTLDQVAVIDSEPPLDIKGDPCNQVAVAYQAADGTRAGPDDLVYYLDLRRLGRAPRVVIFRDEVPDLPQMLDAANLELPQGLAGQVLSNTVVDRLQVLQVGLIMDLATQVFDALDAHTVVEASAPPFGMYHSTPASSLDNRQPAQQTALGIEPTRFGQPRETPEAHVALQLDEEEASEDEDLQLIEANFQVHMPRYTPEVLHIALRAPCALDDALHEVSEFRNSDVSIQFDNLIPVEPQPATTFACILALPDWDLGMPCCLIDAREIDNRLYASFLSERLNRSSLLLQIGVIDQPGLQVYVATDLMDDRQLYMLHHGATITILPPDKVFRPGQTLEQMLRSPAGWQLPCPVFEGPDEHAFAFLSDGAWKAIHVDLLQATNSAMIKQLAADHFQYQLERTTVCPSKPRLLDVMVRGQLCRAVLTATEQISRIPVPPGRLLPSQHILFIDERRLLCDISWRLVPRGFLNLSKLIVELQAKVPTGYAVEVRGATVVHRGRRTLLQVEPGQLITAICVEDPPATADHQDSSSDGPDDGAESQDDSTSTDCIFKSSSSSNPPSRPARSRSPRGPPPPEPSGHAAGWSVTHKQAVVPRWQNTTLHDPINALSDNCLLRGSFSAIVDSKQMQVKQARLLDASLALSAADAQLLQQLRSITLQMGGTWMHTGRLLFPDELQPPAIEPMQVRPRVPEITMWLHCAILKEGYTPECISIQLVIPATPAEALEALQAARDPAIRALFPHVIDVHPQPGHGTAVYVAAAVWCPEMQGACIDTSQLDERVYTAHLPDYITRRELLALVAHPQREELQVCIGVAPNALDDDFPVHLYPGVLITVLPPHADLPLPYTTGQLLMMRDAWSTNYSLPAPADQGAICLIAAERARLHTANTQRPDRYLADIAAAVGTTVNQMRLYAARPPPADIAIQGVHCQTAIVVGDQRRHEPHSVWHCALLDCRPVQEGWRTLYVHEGRFNAQAVLTSLCEGAPPGWQPHLDTPIDHQGFSSAQPGQVIVASYAVAPATSSTSQAASSSPGTDTSSAGPSTGHQEDGTRQPTSEEPHTPQSETTEEAVAATEQEEVLLTVFIFSQEYTPEQYSIHVSPPRSVEQLLGCVERHRRTADARFFPDLQVVHPQPSGGLIALLATPAWPYQGTPILIQILGPAARIFSVYAPAVLSHADVLTLAHCAQEAHCHVYIGDTPWPIPEDGAFPVRRGDLVTICPATHLQPRLRPLTAALQEAHGTEWTHQLPAYWNAGAWIRTDQQHFHASITPPPNPAMHGDVARAMTVSPDDLNIGQASPPIQDHAHRGLTSTSVIVSLAKQLDTHEVSPEAIPYILDLRPLLLPLSAMRSDTNTVLVTDLYRRVQSHCPRGFNLRFYGGVSSIDSANHHRWVEPGTVIRVELQPSAPDAATHGDSDVPPSGELSASHRTAPHGATPQTIAPTQHTQASDTGGTTGGAGFRTVRHTASRKHFVMPTFKPLCLLFLLFLMIVASPQATTSWHTYHEKLNARIAVTALCLNVVCIRTRPLLMPPLLLTVAFLSDGALSVQAVRAAQHPHVVPVDKNGLGHHSDDLQLCGRPFRPIPTPCRQPDMPKPRHEDTEWVDWDCLGSLQTLLEECNATTQHHHFLAATLVETLDEHFHEKRQLPLTVSLDRMLPTTSYQQQVLSLQRTLAEALEPSTSSEPDWLDNDTSLLFSDPKVPLEKRTQFVNVRTWHEAGCPPPHVLQVYTDGSASNAAQDTAPCAWAFGVWVPHQSHQLLLGHASGTAVPPDTPYSLGETNDTPQTSEQLALAWALIWAVSYANRFASPVEFAYDCLVAGKGAFGDWKLPAQSDAAGSSQLAINLVCLRHLAQARLHVQHRHVKGHAGQLENEYADQLAKKARREPADVYNRMLPTWPAVFLCHPLKQWGWITAAPPVDLPALYAFESEADRLQTLDARASQAPFSVEHKPPPQIACVYQFAVISYNTLTMRDPAEKKGEAKVGLRISGRKALLKHQFAEHRPLLVGLQETRLPDTGMQPDEEYLIYQSACTTAGHYGCSLWIARQVPYARRGQHPLFLEPSHVNVMGLSPRHIAVHIKAEAFHMLVMVCHSPNAYSAPLSEYSAFWRERADELAKRPAGCDYVILADANARLGHLQTEHVGGHQPEDENQPGELFHDFLAANQAFLPSTFAEFHDGDGHTWVSPGGDKHRIDYVILPSTWQEFSLRSRVLYDIELLQLRDDHYPVYVQCEFGRNAPPASYPASTRTARRPQRPGTPNETQQAVRALQSIPTIPWQTDIDVHYDALAQQWQRVGNLLDPPSRHAQGPTQPYLSEHASQLVTWRKALRQHLRQETGERNRRTLIFVFVAFRFHASGVAFTPAQRQTLDTWYRELDMSEAEALHRMYVYGYYLRKQVALDRRRYLQQLAANVSLQDVRDPRALYQAVRKAFPAAKGAKRAAFRPLPAVRDEEGQLVVTAEDRAERWRAFFGAQEAGFEATDEQYVRHMSEQPKLQASTVFDIQVVPTLLELEGITQALNPRKAAGLDQVASELLQVHVPTTMRQFLPVCVKASLALREPCQFRGGELICLAKKAGAALQCTGFRSILISSVPGKVLHRALRTRLLEVLIRHRPALQAGAVPGEGIETIAIAAQSFQLFKEGQRMPWALVFYDVQTAFYSVIRELIVPSTHTDEGLLRLL